jgi:hypothetical protein
MSDKKKESPGTAGTVSGLGSRCYKASTATFSKATGNRQAQAANNFSIPYDKAVTEGRNLIKQMDAEERRVQMRLGELAARIEPIHGDRTIAKFAKELGYSTCTMHRFRKVYEAWDGMEIVAPGPVSYAVLRELKDHPNREAIVKEDPKISKRDAIKFKREHEGKPTNKKQTNKSRDGQQEELKRWLRQVIGLANDVIRAAGQVQVTDALLQIVEPDLLPTLREAGAAFLSLADQLEHQDKQAEPEKQAERVDIAA